MPIRPFLYGEPFDPARIEDMSQAFTAVCDKLGLVKQDDEATRTVAKAVIEFAQCGLHGAELLSAVLEQYEHGE